MEVERQESSKARLHTEAGEVTRLHSDLSRVQGDLSRSQNETGRLQAELARAIAESERGREKYEAGQQDIVRLKMAVEKSEAELQVRSLSPQLIQTLGRLVSQLIGYPIESILAASIAGYGPSHGAHE